MYFAGHILKTSERESSEGDTSRDAVAKTGQKVLRSDPPTFKLPAGSENKLLPKWTGPFRITEALENGAYRLETLEGGAIPRTWNATHLKLYYS